MNPEPIMKYFPTWDHYDPGPDWVQAPCRFGGRLMVKREYSDHEAARTALYNIRPVQGCFSAWPGVDKYLAAWWTEYHKALPGFAGLYVAAAEVEIVANTAPYRSGPYGASRYTDTGVQAMQLLADGSVAPVPPADALAHRPADGGYPYRGIGDSSACLAESAQWCEGQFWFWR